VIGRRSLGAVDDPIIELLFDTGPIRFDSGWSAPRAGIAIFDGVFVAENVHSGDVVDIEQKRNLYRVIVGDQGVKLAERDAALATQSRAMTDEISTAAKAVQGHVPGSMKIDAFVALPAAADIDNQIYIQESSVEAAHQADAIRDRKTLSEFTLPDLPARFTEILRMTVDRVAEDAEKRLVDHIAAHDMAEGGSNWIAEGLKHADETCPFCGQGIDGSQLVAAFRAVFSERYEALVSDIGSLKTLVGELFGDTALARLETLAVQNRSGAEFWAKYCEFDEPSQKLPAEMETAVSQLRTAALALVSKKASAPLKATETDQPFTTALAQYEQLKAAVALANNGIRTANALIAAKKTATGAVDLKTAEAELIRLKAVKTRHTPAVAALCTDHAKLVQDSVSAAITEASVGWKDHPKP
jgi:wobble nucleotide-excising tRNase